MTARLDAINLVDFIMTDVEVLQIGRQLRHRCYGVVRKVEVSEPFELLKTSIVRNFVVAQVYLYEFFAIFNLADVEYLVELQLTILYVGQLLDALQI